MQEEQDKTNDDQTKTDLKAHEIWQWCSMIESSSLISKLPLKFKNKI